MKLTRRNLFGALAASPAIAQTETQNPAGEDEMKAARDRLRSAAQALAKQEVPMATEPAFQFKP